MKYPVENEVIRAIHKSEYSTEPLFDLLQQGESVFLHNCFEDNYESKLSKIHSFKLGNEDFSNDSSTKNANKVIINNNNTNNTKDNISFFYKVKNNKNNNYKDYNNFDKSTSDSNNNSNIIENQNIVNNKQNFNSNDNSLVRKIFSQYTWFTEEKYPCLPSYPASSKQSNLIIPKRKSKHINNGLCSSKITEACDEDGIKNEIPLLFYNQDSSSVDINILNPNNKTTESYTKTNLPISSVCFYELEFNKPHKSLPVHAHTSQTSGNCFLQTTNATKAKKKKTPIIENEILRTELKEVDKMATSLFFLNNFQPFAESKFKEEDLTNSVAPLPTTFSKETSGDNIMKQKLTVFGNTEIDLWFKNQYLVPTLPPVPNSEVSQLSKNTFTSNITEGTSLTDIKKTIFNVDNFLRLRNIQSYKKNMLSVCKFSKKSSQLFKWKLESVKEVVNEVLPTIVEELTSDNYLNISQTPANVVLPDDVQFNNKPIVSQTNEKIEYIVLKSIPLVPLSFLSDCSDKVEINSWMRESITINQCEQTKRTLTSKTSHFEKMNTKVLVNNEQKTKISYYEKFIEKSEANSNNLKKSEANISNLEKSEANSNNLEKSETKSDDIVTNSDSLQTTELKTPLQKTMTTNTENLYENVLVESEHSLTFDSANVQESCRTNDYLYDDLCKGPNGSYDDCDFYENYYIKDYLNLLSESESESESENEFENTLEQQNKSISYNMQKEKENTDVTTHPQCPVTSLQQRNNRFQTEECVSKTEEETKRENEIYKTKGILFEENLFQKENSLFENCNNVYENRLNNFQLTPQKFTDIFIDSFDEKTKNRSKIFRTNKYLSKNRNMKNRYKTIMAHKNFLPEDIFSTNFDVDENGNSCLHIAAMNCDITRIKYILRNGGNVFKRNNNNLLPIDVAGDFQTASLFSSAMLFYGHK